MISYPSILPLATKNNYTYNHVEPLIVTQLNSGRKRQRRRFFSVPTIVNLTWIFNNGQMQIFEAFYTYDLKDGAEWFTMPIKTAKVVNDTECRFTGMYNNQLHSEYWFVTAEVETRKRDLITEDEYRHTPELFLHSDIVDLAVNKKFPSV